MKIYGQNLGDIFRRLPWQFQIVTVLAACFILFIIVYVPYTLTHMQLRQPEPPVAPLKFSGTTPAGALDPSIAYDPLDKKAWMAYTEQTLSSYTSAGGAMGIRIAQADPARACKVWRPVTVAFAGKKDNLLAPDGQKVLSAGVWRVETPSLIYDPDDRGREWKLYAYKYFWADDAKSALQVVQRYGAIVYKYASDPAKEWSTEQWLFAPAPGFPPPPYEQMVLLHMSRLDPSLKDIVSFSRPSAIYRKGVIVMTLSAFTAGLSLDRSAFPSPDRVVMITSADHGNSWRYAGTVLRQADMAALSPAARLAGATLVEQDGQVYLAAIIGNARQHGQGTFIFGFDDLSQGLLHRDAKTGMPALLHEVDLPEEKAGTLGGGAAAYQDACNTGLVVAEQIGNSPDYRLWRTKTKPIEPVKGE